MHILKKCDSTTKNLDVMLIPKNTSKLGIIIEFKRIKDTSPKTMEEGVHDALDQIEENKYEAELQDRDITDIWKLAIVFKGKRVKIVEGDNYGGADSCDKLPMKVLDNIK